MTNEEFLKLELDEWSPIYSNINFAISEVAEFLDEDDLKRRKYYQKIKLLDQYIALLQTAVNNNGTTFFAKLKDDSSDENKCKQFKSKHRSDFIQLSNCSKCECLDCIKECKFETCSGCRQDSFIRKCDRSKLNVRNHTNFRIDLVNNDTGEDDTFKVLATLNNCELDNLYIVLENIHDSSHKLILYYYPGISSDDFGEITDSDEFESIVEAYEGSEY